MASIRRRHSRLSSGWRRPLVAGTVSRRRFSGVASDRPGGSGHARDGMPSADQGPTRDGRSPAGGRHEAMAIIKASGPLAALVVLLVALTLVQSVSQADDNEQPDLRIQVVGLKAGSQR